MRDAEVRYAEQRDGKCLAYEVFGSGPSDVIVFQNSFPIDLLWDLPQLASFMEALGGMARMIVYDALGQGASDSVSGMGAAHLEEGAENALAVLDAVHADRVTFFDMAYGVNGLVFAATYPQRVRSLIMTNFRPSFPQFRDMPMEQLRQVARARLATKSL